MGSEAVSTRRESTPVASSASGSPPAVTLEQLIALNEEMAALIRAGVPLEQGLAALGGALPRSPAQMVQRLSQRMAGGESLTQVLDDPQQFPPVWRAVVQAGLRSGRLAAALESLSQTARRLADVRRILSAGLVYPLIVVLLAYLLFVFLTVWLAPVVFEASRDLAGRVSWVSAALTRLGELVWWWAIPVPVLGGLLLVGGWRHLGRSLWSKSSPPRRGRKRSWDWRFLSIRQAFQESRMATFAEVLALLVEQQVPLGESLVLAAQASGDGNLVEGAKQVAERLERGELLRHRDDLPAGFPPLLGWIFIAGMLQHNLPETLRRSARIYRARAARTAHWTAVCGPLVLTVVVGGSAVLVCALLAFFPIFQMLYQLTQPVR